jgi:DNA-binding transcriptional regulator YhcF (GntR family)
MSEGRLADRAYTGIVEMINADGLAVGDRLPSEARLAEIFGMSRTVVREALVRLAADSITEARRGAGSFVKNRPSDKLSAYMPLSELPSTLGSYEVRFVLEAEAARLAAARRSVEEMASIEEGLSDLRAALRGALCEGLDDHASPARPAWRRATAGARRCPGARWPLRRLQDAPTSPIGCPAGWRACSDRPGGRGGAGARQGWPPAGRIAWAPRSPREDGRDSCVGGQSRPLRSLCPTPEFRRWRAPADRAKASGRRL